VSDNNNNETTTTKMTTISNQFKSPTTKKYDAALDELSNLVCGSRWYTRKQKEIETLLETIEGEAINLNKASNQNELTEKTKTRLFDAPKMLTARRHVELYGGPKNTAEYVEANWPKETSKNKTAIFHHLNAIAKADFSGKIKLPADAPFAN